MLGLVVAMSWAGVIMKSDAWYLLDALWMLVIATLSVFLFHHRRKGFRASAVVLFPALLWTFSLPRETKARLKELKENEQQQP